MDLKDMEVFVDIRLESSKYVSRVGRGETNDESSCLRIDPPKLVLRKGHVAFDLTISGTTSRSQKLVLVVECSADDERRKNVRSTFSAGFYAIRHVLRVDPLCNVHDTFLTFWKDKESHIDLNVRLEDHKGDVVKGRPLTLLVQLTYEDGQRVGRDSLVLMGTDEDDARQKHLNRSDVICLGRDGMRTIKCRPELVDSRPFLLVVYAYAEHDVGPVVSCPIRVRAKMKLSTTSSEDDGSSRPQKKPKTTTEPEYVPLRIERERELTQFVNMSPNDSADTKTEIALRNITLWSRKALGVLDWMQFEMVGYSLGADGLPDGAQHIMRCPSCWSYRDSTTQQPHKSTCSLASMIRLWQKHVPNSLKLLRECGILKEECETPSLPKALVMEKSDSWMSTTSIDSDGVDREAPLPTQMVTLARAMSSEIHRAIAGEAPQPLTGPELFERKERTGSFWAT